MGNHEHPCEFCGEDRRLVTNCCTEYVASETVKRQQIIERHDHIVGLLTELGIPFYGNGSGSIILEQRDPKRLEELVKIVRGAGYARV